MVRIAVAGAGGIAQMHVKALMAIPEARIVGIIDVRSERAQELAALCGASVFHSLDECIDRVDAVYILTPPSTHRELALTAIHSGKHIICEKPLAIHLEDAQMMVNAAKEAGVIFITTFNMRFRRGYKQLKEIYDSGRLGRMITFWNQRMGMGFPTSYNWRTDPELLCGITIESLSHDIDLIHWIAGDITCVQGAVHESPSIPGLDDNSHALLTLKNGAVATLHVSWTSEISLSTRGIIGSEGTAYVRGDGIWDVKTIHLKTKDMDHEQIDIVDDFFDIQSYIDENRHFIHAIAHNETPAVQGEDGLNALKISHAILHSSKNRCCIKL